MCCERRPKNSSNTNDVYYINNTAARFIVRGTLTPMLSSCRYCFQLCPVSLNISRQAVSQSELPQRPCVAMAVICVRPPRSTSSHWYLSELRGDQPPAPGAGRKKNQNTFEPKQQSADFYFSTYLGALKKEKKNQKEQTLIIIVENFSQENQRGIF